MNILSTVKLPDELKKKIETACPSATIHHDKKIEKAMSILPQVDILFTYGDNITAAHIEAATNLKWIMVASAGVDKLPFQEIEKRSIHVTNSRGVHAIPMAEYCMSMMLQVSRQTKTLIQNEQDHKWDQRIKMDELFGKTVYILGTGAIGKGIARLAQAFHMNVIGMNRDGRQIEHFQKVYSQNEIAVPIHEADFIISVLPSTKGTRELLHYDMLKQAKSNTVFINVGRGDVIKETDLIRLLNDKIIKHVVLDVFELEPLPEQNPLWDMENVTITPHLSGVTENYLPRVMPIFIENLEWYIRGDFSKMTNVVDLKKRY